VKGKSRIVFCRIGRRRRRKTRARDIPRFARNDGCLRVGACCECRCISLVRVGEYW